MIREPDGWLGVEIRHFAALQAVSEEGSFRGAAVRLGYTQSAVSQQMATLERAVGERLVNRPGGPRPISLTEAGMMLLRHAGAIMARIHAAQADLAAVSAGLGGTLRVGTYQSVGSCILPGLMRQFMVEWPQVEISLTESGVEAELLGGVERGDLDLTFAVSPVPVGPFEGVELLSDRYVLVVPADSSLVRGTRRASTRDIAGEPLIGFRQCRSMLQVEKHLRDTGIEPQIVFRSDDNGTVQGLVAAGMGMALMPYLSVEPTDPRIVLLDLDDGVPPRRISIIWHSERYRSPAARAFVDAARSVCETLALANDARVSGAGELTAATR